MTLAYFNLDKDSPLDWSGRCGVEGIQLRDDAGWLEFNCEAVRDGGNSIARRCGMEAIQLRDGAGLRDFNCETVRDGGNPIARWCGM